MPLSSNPPFYTRLLVGFLIVLSPSLWAKPSPSSPFRFTLTNEPHTMDPAQMRKTSGNYLLNNIHRSLYRYDSKKGLVPEDAKVCKWIHSKKLRCTLRKSLKWSHGIPLTAHHYEAAFKRLSHPSTRTIQTELILNLKNAKAILKNEKKPSRLGVRALSSNVLEFEFENEDLEFLYKLISPSLAPLPPGLEKYPTKKIQFHKVATNGPYHIEKWLPGRKIILKPNPFYKDWNPRRPQVEILFAEEDNTALDLFSTKRINFVRRLPTKFNKKYKATSYFFRNPMLRFDYIGFGPQLKNSPMLRKALALSLNFEEMRILYDALGIPGCPGISKELMRKVPCITFDLKAAKEALAHVSKPIPLTLAYSKMGGEDVKKGMEWMQYQWKKNLGLTVQLQPVEQGGYLYLLRTKAPTMFRMGYVVDRPTCSAGLELFKSQSPSNYLGWSSSQFDNSLKKLKLSQIPKEKQLLCEKTIQILLDQYRILPLGRIHFTMLQDHKFKNWSINELNQLDLSHIEKSP